MFEQLTEVMNFFKGLYGDSTAAVTKASDEGLEINVLVFLKNAGGDTIQVGVATTYIGSDIIPQLWAEEVAAKLDIEIEKALVVTEPSVEIYTGEQR